MLWQRGRPPRKQDGFHYYSILANTTYKRSVWNLTEKEKVYSINGWCLFWYLVCIVYVGSQAARSGLKQNKPMDAITVSTLSLFSFPLSHVLSLSAPLFFTHFLWLCNLLLKAAGYFPSLSLNFWISLSHTCTFTHVWAEVYFAISISENNNVYQRYE